MNRVYILIVAFLFVFQSASSQDSTKYLAEDLIGIVGDQPVMMTEFKNTMNSVLEFRKQYGTMPGDKSVEVEALESLFSQKLLIHCAKRDSLDKNVSQITIEQQVDEMATNMAIEVGGIKALEALYGKPIYQIKEDLKSSVVENELASSMQFNIKDEVKISIPEVRKFYEEVGVDTLPTVPVQYCYAQIVSVPEATEEKEFEIRERLLDYRERVLKGERLSVLARMYSQAHDGSPQRGGEIGPIDINSLVAPFIAALEQLEPGQISEIVKTEYGYHIIELISKNGNMVHFRHLLLIPEFTIEQVARVTHVLDSVANLLRKDSLTFDEAALRYSNDRATMYNGGKVFNVNSYHATGSLDQTSTYFLAEELQPLEQMKLSKMEVGDVSDCYETLSDKGLIVYKIIKLLDIRPAHKVSLDYEYPYLKEAAYQKKCNEYIMEWLLKELKKCYLYINPQYRNIPFSQPEWLERANECLKESYFVEDYSNNNQ